MKKSIELRRELEELKNKIQTLQGEDKIQEAKALLPDLEDLKNQVEVAEALEKTPGPMNYGTVPTFAKDTKLEKRILNKLLMNKNLTDDEADYLRRTECIKNTAGTPGQVGATNEKGGYLLTDEQFNQILEFRRQYTQLKNFCTIRPANSRHGTQPAIGEETATLTSFDELNEIAQHDIDFSQITYDIKTYGDIIPVARELLQDIDVDLVGLIGRRFARKAVNTENQEILALLKQASSSSGTDYKAIQTALNKTLDPEISATAQILTNQSGFDYLDSLTDTMGRPLLTVSLADPAQRLFKGRPITVLKDTILANDSSAFPFVVGSIADYIHFFERAGVEVATSMEAGFIKNAVLFRCIERFGVTKADANALTYLKITPAGVGG